MNCDCEHCVPQHIPEGFKKVPCKLVGEDGNAFSIMGRVSKVLKKAGHGDLVEGYTERAMSGDYNHLLRVSLEYVYNTGEMDEPDDDDDYWED